MADAYWPKLLSLTLGSFGYNDDFELNSPSNDAAFGAFLSKHSELKYLRLSWNFKRWMSPETIPLALEPTALPNLTTFVGVHQQLAVLPTTRCTPPTGSFFDRNPGSHLQTVVRWEIGWCRRNLGLHIDIPEFKDHSTFFRGLMEACP
ncbi:hypothetical protein EV360DRAFT_89600 [Lentinula raphanica]|nr:hypothetical protein EV360DRAFT_89600 [Lentinula raphanica]